MACKIPFAVVLSCLVLISALVPAILIWVIMYTAMNESMNIVTTASSTSIINLSSTLQHQLINQSLASTAAHIIEATNELDSRHMHVMSTSLRSNSLGPSPTLIPKVVELLGSTCFASVKNHPYFSMIIIEGVQTAPGAAGGLITFWIVQQAMGFDLKNNTFQRTIYTSYLELDPTGSKSTMSVYYPDQTTGEILFKMDAYPYPPIPVWLIQRTGWTSDISFNPYTGQTEVYYEKRSERAVNDTWFDMSLSFNTQTISEELRAQLAGNPLDRLFIFFRKPHGHMLGASHGKYYSMSDIDSRQVNPLVDRPDMAALKPYTCLNSTDVLVLQACQYIYKAGNKTWDGIPELNDEVPLNGTAYWIAVRHGSLGLDCTVVALKHRGSVMGLIESNINQAENQVQTKKMWTYVVLGVATFLAILFPCLMGIWLAAKLSAMEESMQRIQKLHFTYQPATSTIFRELDQFQNAFMQMERGLENLAKLVPEEVLRSESRSAWGGNPTRARDDDDV